MLSLLICVKCCSTEPSLSKSDSPIPLIDHHVVELDSAVLAQIVIGCQHGMKGNTL